MRFSKTKLFTALFFFFLGYMGNTLVDKVRQPDPVSVEGIDRYPVNPDDFDHRKMIEAMRESDHFRPDEKIMDSGASVLGDISQREDDKFVYYEIPIIKEAGINHELKVEVKEGMIKISEMLKDSTNPMIETNAERMFSIDPELDSAMAEVKNENNRVLIKIPKKRL